ncbi:hypothetical protein HKX48_007235 [Thoreauomyces humboldtii]|nr:hypothetical protein HKX48_007235 [Thoreauomyces humboldtii]
MLASHRLLDRPMLRTFRYLRTSPSRTFFTFSPSVSNRSFSPSLENTLPRDPGRASVDPFRAQRGVGRFRYLSGVSKVVEVPDLDIHTRVYRHWSREEKAALTTGLAKNLSIEVIAERLDRTCGQVKKYKSYLSKPRAAGSWKAQDRETLLKLVDWYDANDQPVDWVAIGQELGRKPSACREKWLALTSVRTGRFTPEEDATLIYELEFQAGAKTIDWIAIAAKMQRSGSLDRTPFTDDAKTIIKEMHQKSMRDTGLPGWTKIAEHLGVNVHRVHNLWSNCLDPDLINKGRFTPEEDAQILKATGNISDLAKQMHRSPNSVYTRKYRLLKKKGERS